MGFCWTEEGWMMANVDRTYDPPGVAREFETMKNGHCDECNLPTYPGDWIAEMTNGEHRHADCA